MLRDGPHGLGNARRVGQPQIVLGLAGLGNGNGDLAGHGPGVIVESGFLAVFSHGFGVFSY